MEERFIHDFSDKFGISFGSVKNIEDMGADTYDDGIYHYVDLTTKDVYSFDTNDDFWLEKNEHQSDVLGRLKFIINSNNNQQQTLC